MMNKFKKTSNFVLVGILLFLFVGAALADYTGNKRVPQLLRATDKVTRTLANAGNWAYWITVDGMSAHDPLIDASGGYYPRGTAAAIFQDGIVWGGYVNDGQTPKLRVGGQTYNVGTVAGRILPDGTPANPEDPDVRVYRVRPAYTVPYAQLSDDEKAGAFDALKQDAAENLGIVVDEVTEADIELMVDNYASDYEEWPVQYGAPYYDVNGNGQYDAGYEEDLDNSGTIDIGEKEEPGIGKGDQVVWLVVNDLSIGATSNLYGSPPMGLELQISMWTYNQPSTPLGQIIYKQFKLINKSGVRMDSMFVAQWSDPDVGEAGDDIAGCDIPRSLGYAYNGFLTDDTYDDFNLPPAAAGYDFFAGPVVDSPGDSAIFDLKRVYGKKNLPMTSFSYFAAGSPIGDPDLQNYNGTLEWYTMLNGYIPTTDTLTLNRYLTGDGQETLFPLSGDPFRGTGDLDAKGQNLAPGDRRIVLSSGPFTMQPGDTQTVVLAVVGGIIAQAGGDNKNAVEQMKLNDDFAQFIFDNLFQAIPKPPASPVVNATPFYNEIALEWGSNLGAVAATELDKTLGYEFEGYNVYQLPDPSASLATAKRITTFDVINDITKIKASVFLPAFGDIVEVPVQFGLNTGIQRFITIDHDYIKDKPLYPGNKYYFAVTAYNNNSDPTVPQPSLESALQILTIIPQGEKPGWKYEGKAGDVLDVTHATGISDGLVQAVVIDPSKTTGHDYEVFFTVDDDTNSATYGETLWNLRDVTAGTTVLANQVQAPTPDTPFDERIVDGMIFKVSGPPAGIKAIVQVANGNGPLGPDDFDGAGTPYGGNAVWHSLSAPSDPNRFYVSAGGGGGTLDRLERYAEWLTPRDTEMRFVDTGDNFAVFAFTDDKIAATPWEIWDVGIGTYDDATDDHRMVSFLNENDVTSGAWGWATGEDPYFGFPSSDWVYWMDPEEAAGGYAGFAGVCVASGGAGATYDFSLDNSTDGYYADFHGGFVYPIGRFIVCDFGGGGTAPETGTVIRVISNKINQEADVFTFTTPGVENSTDLAKDAVDKINVFPNPYYAFNPSEAGRGEKFITFNHLPQNITLRIFDLAGTQVRKLTDADKETVESQFLRWDLTNESGLPVGSGLYVALVEMPDLGKEKILKFFVVQRQQILETF